MNQNMEPWAEGQYHFYEQDAKQWAEWGFDYLKYDWNPIKADQVQSMGDASRPAGEILLIAFPTAPVRRGGGLGPSG